MKFLKILLIPSLCLIGVLLSANDAHALRCEKTTPKYSFKTATARTEYIRTKSASSLTEMHGSSPESTVGGLGGGETGFKLETEFSYIADGPAACVNLTKVNLTFYAKPTIHIASNFRRGSCEYGAVMAHEKKHIRELQKFVREYGPKMKNHLVKNVLPTTTTFYGPIDADKVDKAQQKIQDDLFEGLQAYQQEIMPVLQKRQQDIDSPAEYARVDSKCSGWDAMLANPQDEKQ